MLKTDDQKGIARKEGLKGWPEIYEQRWPEWDGRKGWPERDGQQGMTRKGWPERACPDGGPERRGIEDRQKREPEKRAKV